MFTNYIITMHSNLLVDIDQFYLIKYMDFYNFCTICQTMESLVIFRKQKTSIIIPKTINNLPDITTVYFNTRGVIYNYNYPTKFKLYRCAQ